MAYILMGEVVGQLFLGGGSRCTDLESEMLDAGCYSELRCFGAVEGYQEKEILPSKKLRYQISHLWKRNIIFKIVFSEDMYG